MLQFRPCSCPRASARPCAALGLRPPHAHAGTTASFSRPQQRHAGASRFTLRCSRDSSQQQGGSSKDEEGPFSPIRSGPPASSSPSPSPSSPSSSSPSSSSPHPVHPEMTEEARNAVSSDSVRTSLIPDSLPLIGSGTDWREFRARLVSQSRDGSETNHWAHPIPKPEPGSLLLAHPMHFTQSQQYFYQSVILLLQHEEDGGSYGVILNRPSQYTLGKLSLTKDLKEFDDCRLYVGGDVGDGTLRLIHALQGVEGAVEVVKGVYTGGIEAVRQKVAAGEVTPEQCRWFARYAGWGAGQLQRECRAGVWFTAAASPDVILQLPKESNGRDCWHTVLQTMGGNYKLLSDTIRAAEAEANAADKAEEEGRKDKEGDS